MSELSQTCHECRVCGEDSLYPFLDLGSMPPSNGFVASPDEEEQFFPLEVVVCDACNHVQLQHTVDREFLFSEYHYFSSASDPLLEHFGAYADAVESKYLDDGDFVVEIGSNDGVLLSQFGETISTLGVDPAENVAEAARERGVETITELFAPDVAETIVAEYGTADAVCANNVVGHIDDLHGLMEGLDTLLAPEGVFVMEVPYLIDLLSNHQFDTIYHEHISYFSVRALERLVEQFDMQVVDVDRVDVHGGTIRAHIQRQSADRTPERIVSDLEHLELAMGLDRRETYDDFADRVERTRTRINTLLDLLDDEDVSIVGYGAPAKGNVLLNYCDIGPERLDYLLDTTPKKQGTYSPGMNVPVRSPEAFHDDPPEYAFLLAWNYKTAILEKEAAYRESGGQFVVPIPYVDVV
jgi:SAM-dependent methyltransferase